MKYLDQDHYRDVDLHSISDEIADIVTNAGTEKWQEAQLVLPGQDRGIHW